MNKLQIKGSWNELKGKLKQQYGNLTDLGASSATWSMADLVFIMVWFCRTLRQVSTTGSIVWTESSGNELTD